MAINTSALYILYATNMIKNVWLQTIHYPLRCIMIAHDCIGYNNMQHSIISQAVYSYLFNASLWPTGRTTVSTCNPATVFAHYSMCSHSETFLSTHSDTCSLMICIITDWVQFKGSRFWQKEENITTEQKPSVHPHLHLQGMTNTQLVLCFSYTALCLYWIL